MTTRQDMRERVRLPWLPCSRAQTRRSVARISGWPISSFSTSCGSEECEEKRADAKEVQSCALFLLSGAREPARGFAHPPASSAFRGHPGWTSLLDVDARCGSVPPLDPVWHRAGCGSE